MHIYSLFLWSVMLGDTDKLIRYKEIIIHLLIGYYLSEVSYDYQNLWKKRRISIFEEMVNF